MDKYDELGAWAVPALWAMQYRKLGNKHVRFASAKDPFCHRPWQIAPLNDMSRTVVVKKARQMGFTELFITDMFHIATLIRSRAVYTLPKNDKAQELARTRIDPVGRPSHPDAFTGDILDRLQQGWKSYMYKSIIPKYGGGTSEILVTGSWNEDLGESTAADQVYLDEYDRMRPGVISAFKESLSASRIRRLRVFSTPTFPKTGVDDQYNISNRMRWFYKCTSCGKWQYLSRGNIVQRSGSPTIVQRLESRDSTVQVPDGTFDIVCLQCHQTINRMGATCEWVAEVENAELNGYHVSQLDCAWISADKIMRSMREHHLSKWQNYVLGETYLGGAEHLVENFVYQLIDPALVIHDRNDFDKQYRATKVIVGVDWGKTNYCMVLGITPDLLHPVLLEPYHFSDTNDPDTSITEVKNLAERWRADVVVADYGYGADRNPKLYRALHCRFWACKYPPARSVKATEKAVYDSPAAIQRAPYPLLHVGRTPTLKSRLAELFAKRLIIPNVTRFERYLDMLDLHCRNVVIDVEEQTDGTMEEVAVTIGADHMLHAFNYATLGIQYLQNHDIRVGEVAPPQSIMPQVSDGIGIPTGSDIVDALDIFG